MPCMCGDSECPSCGVAQGTHTTRYFIQDRWPASARWRYTTAAPHSERFPFDPVTHRVRFETRREADQAADTMRRCNAGEFRVVAEVA